MMYRNLVFLAAFAATGAAYADVVPTSRPYEWKVTHQSWTDRDEQGFSNFIADIGNSGCNTADSCLKSFANPYRDTDPVDYVWNSDCADWPYVLRAYYAWKNGLPFSFESSISSNDPAPLPPAKLDIRYSHLGNRVTSRYQVLGDAAGNFPIGMDVIVRMRNVVSSAMYRTAPNATSRANFNDFYPAAIEPESIRPGTVVYDPNGHVAIVYKVESDGRIRMMDAHPDNSVSHIVYGKKFSRSSEAVGAGFKNWKPQYLEGARPLKVRTGGSFFNRTYVTYYLGGQTLAPSNQDLSRYSNLTTYSQEQFYGNVDPANTDWKQAKFNIGFQSVDYFEYVRRKMSGVDEINPVNEFSQMLDQLCDDFRERADSVQASVKAGLPLQAHPGLLPHNIYGSDGDWETYSTSARDARFKTSFKELREFAGKVLDAYYKNADSDLKLDIQPGTDLKAALIGVYTAKAPACRIAYRKANGAALSLHDAIVRAYAISFDPYHCEQRRWGATDAAELKGCTDDADKATWYAAEAKLRNTLDRNTDLKMDFSAADYLSGGPASALGASSAERPDLDTYGFLVNYR